MSLFSGIDANDHQRSQSLSQPFSSIYSEHNPVDENRPPDLEYRGLYQIPGGFWDLAIGEYIAFNHISHIESSRHSFNFLPTTPAQRNPSHSQLTDDGAGDFGETPGSSVLGRRKRTESLADWSPPTKARLTLYAGEVAGEYEVPESSHEEFINASIVSSCYPCRRTE